MTTAIRGSKSEHAYSWLHQRIVSRQFGPGYRLVLGALAEELDMSVVPVREAIRRLEAEGLVTFERNVGARVTLIDESAYAHAMQTLGIVEGAATALSAPLLASADLERAQAINNQLLALLDHFDAHAFTTLNRQFHSILFEPCPNPDLLDLVHRGWARLAGIRDSSFAYVPGRAEHSVHEHTEILRLIREGAPASDIEQAARNHRWRTRDALLASRHTPHIAVEGQL
ncbi:GntR family transcriptional regulator [Microbacterium sp. YY-01]|uniref:GntR family transcriptional regulator n=1 Tax=Microbacterium sp. YY-01 TaxID=3421634 RepID=UPI003D169F56